MTLIFEVTIWHFKTDQMEKYILAAQYHQLNHTAGILLHTDKALPHIPLLPENIQNEFFLLTCLLAIQKSSE